jgi:hypothetical protein
VASKKKLEQDLRQEQTRVERCKLGEGPGLGATYVARIGTCRACLVAAVCDAVVAGKPIPDWAMRRLVLAARGDPLLLKVLDTLEIVESPAA